MWENENEKDEVIMLYFIKDAIHCKTHYFLGNTKKGKTLPIKVWHTIVAYIRHILISEILSVKIYALELMNHGSLTVG